VEVGARERGEEHQCQENEDQALPSIPFGTKPRRGRKRGNHQGARTPRWRWRKRVPAADPPQFRSLREICIRRDAEYDARDERAPQRPPLRRHVTARPARRRRLRRDGPMVRWSDAGLAGTGEDGREDDARDDARPRAPAATSTSTAASVLPNGRPWRCYSRLRVRSCASGAKRLTRCTHATSCPPRKFQMVPR
jgi:hypothetical protein